MRIIVDAFGGDNAPLEILKGAVAAKIEFGCDILLCGDEEQIRACAKENDIDLTGMDIENAEGFIPVEEDPRALLKKYKNSSLGVACRALAEGKGDALVSAGSTGALVVGAIFIVKRLKGVRRPAIATIMPGDKGNFMLIDGGANTEVTPDALNTFAVMGSVYMDKVMGVQDPKVGLLNIGAEPNKGTDLQKHAYPLLEENEHIHFIGNAEARDVPACVADVVVCDGFTGNVFLKTYEGVALTLFSNVKDIMMKSTMTKLAALILKGGLKELKTKFDSNAVGGAPILGVQKPVIKAHGSSKEVAFKNAIRQAISFTESGAIATIEENLPKKERADEREAALHELEGKLGYTFSDLHLLDTALTHSSYANEQGPGHKYNERLEFLGDSVLGFITADKFFHAFRDIPEGRLTKLRASTVCEESLFEFAKQIDLGDYLLLGKGEDKNGGRERASIVSDAFEAVIAAIYLDGSIDPAREFVLRFVMTAVEEKTITFKDYKTKLQEIIQKNPEEQLQYVLAGESGPDHNKRFEVEVHLNSNVIGRGIGRTKKQAEQEAAREALALMGL